MATIDSSYVTFAIKLGNGNPVTGAVPLNEGLVFEFTGKLQHLLSGILSRFRFTYTEKEIIIIIIIIIITLPIHLR